MHTKIRDTSSRFILRLIGGGTLLALAMACVIVPACGGLKASRSAANRLKNTTQVRMLAQSMVLYANTYTMEAMPGEDDPTATPGFPKGDTATEQLAALMQKQPIDGELLIAPRDDQKEAWDGSSPLTLKNFSYALLDADSPWYTNSTQSNVPLVADRLIGTGSIWADPWEGCVAWGDASATYETSQTLKTAGDGADDIFAGNVSKDIVMRHD